MNTFKDYINQVTDLIGNTISNLLLTAAVAAFMFAVVSFLWKRAKGTNGEGLKDASNQLGWSIIALFVMFSIWGIINFLQSGFFTGGVKTQITAPSIKIDSSISVSPATGLNSKKKIGASCTVLSSPNTECDTGLVCKSNDSAKTGVVGAAGKCVDTNVSTPPAVDGSGQIKPNNLGLGMTCTKSGECAGALICNSAKKCADPNEGIDCLSPMGYNTGACN